MTAATERTGFELARFVRVACGHYYPLGVHHLVALLERLAAGSGPACSPGDGGLLPPLMVESNGPDFRSLQTVETPEKAVALPW